MKTGLIEGASRDTPAIVRPIRHQMRRPEFVSHLRCRVLSLSPPPRSCTTVFTCTSTVLVIARYRLRTQPRAELYRAPSPWIQLLHRGLYRKARRGHRNLFPSRRRRRGTWPRARRTSQGRAAKLTNVTDIFILCNGITMIKNGSTYISS